MKKFAFLILAGLVLFSHAGLSADTLAPKLPAETTCYAYIDAGRMIKEGADLFKFIDENHGNAAVAQIKELYSAWKLLAKQHEFTPKIFDHLTELNLYVVLMKKDKPVT